MPVATSRDRLLAIVVHMLKKDRREVQYNVDEARFYDHFVPSPLSAKRY